MLSTAALRGVRKVLLVLGAIVMVLFVGGVLAGEAGARTLTASYYGKAFAGATTASGETFDPYDYTAASKTYPFGTKLEVCYQGCTVVTVNDRGPYTAGRDIDLSLAAARDIGLTGVGEAPVEVTEVGSGGSAVSTGASENPEPVSNAPQESSFTAAPQDESSSSQASLSEGEGSTYSVGYGDTLFEIAASFGTSVNALAEANDIANPNVIYAGNVLRIVDAAL